MMRADDNDDKSPMAGLYAYFMLSSDSAAITLPFVIKIHACF